MPKMTVKYHSALLIAELSRIDIAGSQEQLYSALNNQGWHWSSNDQCWQQSDIPPDAPTDLIRVRVSTANDKVQEAADQLRIAMEQQGYELLETSLPYPCRPPKQLESRVYLTFRKLPLNGDD